jgi:hypothetical protein
MAGFNGAAPGHPDGAEVGDGSLALQMAFLFHDPGCGARALTDGRRQGSRQQGSKRLGAGNRQQGSKRLAAGNRQQGRRQKGTSADMRQYPEDLFTR